MPLSIIERPEAPPVAPPEPPRRHDSGRSGPLLTTARTLTAIGLAVAVFLAYEFLVTGLVFRRSQDSLVSTFKQNVVNGLVSDPPATPAEGDPVALISIPSIGVDDAVVDGTTPDDLKAGPGHLRSSPRPGQFGNVVIVGRRTTYGGPFHDLDHLAKGDRITVTTGGGAFVYAVSDVHRSDAGAPDPLNGSLDSRLTLITSDPAFVPDGRLAVVATLVGRPTDLPGRAPATVSAGDLGLNGDAVGLWLAVLWGGLLAGAVWVVWRFSRLWPTRVRYLIGAPIILTLVVLTLSNLDRALPGSL